MLVVVLVGVGVLVSVVVGVGVQVGVGVKMDEPWIWLSRLPVEEPSSRSHHRRAARSPAASTVPSPSGVGGKARRVSQSAAAAAPAREHSRLISPRCPTADV